MARGWLDEII